MMTRLRDKGQITIPLSLRQAFGLSKDSVVSIAKVGDAILLTPQSLSFESISHKFSTQAKKQGMTLEALLKDLRKIRQSRK